MPEQLSIALLTRANLAPDWMTLFVGHRGIELTFRTLELPFDDVRAFAIDQLAAVAGTPDEWDVFLIVDAVSRYDATAEDVFHSLAKRADISVDHALRKWRYAVIVDDLPRIEREGESRATSPCWTWNDVWIARGHHLYDLVHEWPTIISENPPPEIALDWDEELVRKNFDVVRAWLPTEYEAIIIDI
jgi:hypothetical protein